MTIITASWMRKAYAWYVVGGALVTGVRTAQRSVAKAQIEEPMIWWRFIFYNPVAKGFLVGTNANPPNSRTLSNLLAHAPASVWSHPA